MKREELIQQKCDRLINLNKVLKKFIYRHYNLFPAKDERDEATSNEIEMLDSDIETIDQMIDSLSPVDKGEASLTAEEVLDSKGLGFFSNGNGVSYNDVISIMEEYSALRKVEQSLTAEEWYARQTHRRIMEFDDYDLHVCRVATQYLEFLIKLPNKEQITIDLNDDEFNEPSFIKSPIIQRKVEMPSEEDINKEHPQYFKDNHHPDFYQGFDWGAKWAIEQIKHLNKLT